MEKLNIKTFVEFKMLLQQLTHTVLHILESDSPSLLTASDVLYLSQLIEMNVTELGSTHSVGDDGAKIMESIATNYVKVASVLLEPHTATQWMGRTEDGVRSSCICLLKCFLWSSYYYAALEMLNQDVSGSVDSTDNGPSTV